MRYNVAQLLKASVGATRQYNVDEPFGPTGDVPFVGNVHGSVKLTRVNQGIVVRAELAAPVRLECSRCLEEFEQELPLSFEERFIPTIDVTTGLPTHDSAEDADDEDVYSIDDHHELDLHEAVRQQALMNLPLQPIHAESCRGLCPVCGVNRNERLCTCAVDRPADPRLAPLRQLLRRS
jgi:uncharacterized protein